MADQLTVYLLRATRPGSLPGPTTSLRLFRRTTSPDSFTVEPLPEVTAAPVITVQGTTERDIVVVVRVEGGAAPAQARKRAGTERSTVDVALERDREQRLTITGEDLAGNRTAPVVRTIVQDSTAPPPPTGIHVLNANGNTVIPPAPVSVTRTILGGRADQATRVEATIPGGGALGAPVYADGSFAFTVDLAEGDNPFSLVAVDAPGNHSAPASVVIVRDTTPPAPPSDLAVSGRPVTPETTVFVVSPDLVIAGRAEPGAMVEATGDGGFAMGTAASPDGSFTLPLHLTQPLTRINVEAVDAAGNRSAPASFTVVWFRIF